MARSRLDNDLSPDQIQWISIGLTVFIIPAAFMMYRHYKSLQARYPEAVEVKAPGTSKTKKRS